jgi:hypothetical protein
MADAGGFVGEFDAVAVVAGAFSGAWAGSVPSRWVDRLDDLGQHAR